MRIDYANLMAEMVAEHGIAYDDITKYSEKTKEFHRDLMEKRKSGELPFYELPYRDISGLKALADDVRDRFKNLVVIGIGGSGLGNIMLHQALNPIYYNELPQEKRGGPRFYILDNVDPAKLKATLDVIDLNETCFNVISKSGSTAETMANFLVVYELLKERLPQDEVSEHIVVTTDPNSGDLKRIAENLGCRTLVVPPGVGGRFSVLSDVGLFSAAVLGIDVDAILKGAREMDKAVSIDDLLKNPAYILAVCFYLLNVQKGKDILVVMPYAEQLYSFADWFRQLWGESLGKEGKGQTPVKALGTVDQHSQIQLYNEGPNDKIVTFIGVEDFGCDFAIKGSFQDINSASYFAGHTIAEVMKSAMDGTRVALTKNKRPNCTITLESVSPENVGKMIYLFEVMTAFSGYLYEINPYDQPGVEGGKIAMYTLLGRKGYEDRLDEIKRYLAKGANHTLDC